jgi:hypothetical protein
MTSEAVARHIAIQVIRASVQAGCSPGQMLRPDKVNFSAGKIADIPAGMEYAVQQGWAEEVIQPGGGKDYRLTKAGHAASS